MMKRILRGTCGLARGLVCEGPSAWSLLYPPMRPSAIVIGAQKAGTTAVYRYLSRHPAVAASKVKEIDFFNCDGRYARGMDFYHAHFPRRTPGNRGKMTLDVTPGYMAGAEQAAPRIRSYDAGMKLIALLREPVARAYSAWHHYRENHRRDPGWFGAWVRRCGGSAAADRFVARTRPFGEDFLPDMLEEVDVMQRGGIIEMPIVRLGMYHRFLTLYFRHFSREQILVLCSEQMAGDTAGELRKIEGFLGLEPAEWTDADTRPESVGGYTSAIPPDAAAALASFYREPNESLFSLLGCELPWRRMA